MMFPDQSKSTDHTVVHQVSSVNEGKYICKGNNTSDGVPYSNTNYTWVRICEYNKHFQRFYSFSEFLLIFRVFNRFQSFYSFSEFLRIFA